MATGRSDYPNQVNNVLGFPFIFRGALDVEATSINEEMKMAAAMALAELGRKEVPDSVRYIYKNEHLEFGPRYIIPKPFDPRVLETVASAVAKAAMFTGVARKKVDLDEYRVKLATRLDSSQEVLQLIIRKAQADPGGLSFPKVTRRRYCGPPSSYAKKRSLSRCFSERVTRLSKQRSGFGFRIRALRSSIRRASMDWMSTPKNSTTCGSAKG